MRTTSLAVLGGLLTVAGVTLAQPDPLQSAASALGTDRVYSLRVTGSGANFSVGQAYTAGQAWPLVNVKSFAMSANFDTGSAYTSLVRELPTPMPLGGGAPFQGEQRQDFFVSGAYAWNGFPPAPPMPTPPTAAGAAPPAAPPAAQPPAVPPGPGPQPAAVVLERQLALWSLPHGFIKAAQAHNATTRQMKTVTEVSFTLEGKHRVVGTLNAANQVERVRTWIPNPVMGDMVVETTFSGYRDFGGISFPARIVQTQGGHPSLDINVTGVEVNPVVSVIIPPSVYMAAPPPPINVASEQVAPGVFYLTGGSHHSVAIEMRDHIVVVDLPLTVARGEAVLAKAKELIPNKPVRSVINTHAHFDHSSGLRAAVAEGATIVTHQSNVAFFTSALSAPRTIEPDKAASTPVRPKVQGVGQRGQLSDGSRTIQLHQIGNNRHNTGFLLIYLPAEKVLIEADAYTPGPANAPPVPSNPNSVALADTIARLKLSVDKILAMHGPRVTTMADLTASSARSGTN